LTHRLHHQFSDEQPDPHSPRVTFWWSHVTWIVVVNRTLETLSSYERYVPDLLADPFQRWIHRRFNWLWIYLAHALLASVLCLAIGVLLHGWGDEAVQAGTSLFLWTVIVRTVYV